MTRTPRTSWIAALPLFVALGCGEDGNAPDADGTGTTDGGDDADDGSSISATSPGPTSASTDPDTTGDSADDDPGESSSDDAEGTTTSDSGETTAGSVAPSVVMTVPADGATGVAADATIVVTFDQPMDALSVQQAWQSADLPAASVVFSWNDAGDELTVTPNVPFEYAAGTDPDDTIANTYSFAINGAAQSEAGEALASEVSVEFSTLRRLTQTLARDEALSGNVSESGSMLGTTYVGDRNGDDGVRYAVTFDLAAMAPDVAVVESASLSAAWTQQSGNPWGGLGGGTVVQHVGFATLDGDVYALAAVGQGIGLFGSVADTDVDRDVLAPMEATLADPATFANRLQLRVRWLLDSDDDGAYDGVALVPDSLELDVEYLAP